MQNQDLSAIGLGIGFLVTGALLLGLNIYLIEMNQMYLPKLALSSFVFLGWGIGILLFPGPRLTPTPTYKVDLKAPPSVKNGTRVKGGFKDIWRSLRVIDKTMWVISIIFGLFLAYLFFEFYGLSLIGDI